MSTANSAMQGGYSNVFYFVHYARKLHAILGGTQYPSIILTAASRQFSHARGCVYGFPLAIYIKREKGRLYWEGNLISSYILTSLVGNWTPRAPPGQSNETYFFRLIIMSRKQISMLTG